MPRYAIERQYLVPVYQHLFVDAPDLDAACRQALDHDDWDSGETDYDNSRETTIAQAVEIPPDFDLEQCSLSECVYNAGLEQLAIPPQFATGDDPIYHISPEARSLILDRGSTCWPGCRWNTFARCRRVSGRWRYSRRTAWQAAPPPPRAREVPAP